MGNFFETAVGLLFLALAASLLIWLWIGAIIPTYRNNKGWRKDRY